MTLAATCWALCHPVETPAERLVLICIADGTDEYGLAMVDLPALASRAVMSPVGLSDVLVALRERGVLRFRPDLHGIYEDMTGLATSDRHAVIFLPVFDDRVELRPGEEHPIYGEVDLR